MGITNFAQFVTKKFPTVFKQIHISKYSGQKAAADIASYLYRWKLKQPVKWLSLMIPWLTVFKRNNIHVVIVIDGKAPAQKAKTHEKRKEVRLKREADILKINNDLTMWRSGQPPSDFLKGEYVKVMKQRFYENRKKVLQQKSMLTPLKTVDPKLEPKFDESTVDFEKMTISDLQNKLLKLESQQISISDEEHSVIREVSKLMGIPCIDAPQEAEALCSYLCNEKKVDFVISEDSDNVAYHCPIWLSNLQLDGSCRELVLSELLQQMNFTPQQLLDWCISCGTDYNDNVPNHGNAKMFELIKEHKSIENIMKNTTLDCSVLCHESSRKNFSHQNTNFVIPFWNSNYDVSEIDKYLTEKGCENQLRLVHNNWNTVKFVKAENAEQIGITDSIEAANEEKEQKLEELIIETELKGLD